MPSSYTMQVDFQEELVRKGIISDDYDTNGPGVQDRYFLTDLYNEK